MTGLMEQLGLKPGVLYGDDVLKVRVNDDAKDRGPPRTVTEDAPRPQ